MFERLIPSTHAAITAAQQEAATLGASMIGPEHLLLGLLHGSDTLAGTALTTCGIKLEAARAGIARDEAPAPRHGGPPFSSLARHALEKSLREALRLKSNYIGPEHLLLAVLVCDDGAVESMLTLAGTSAPVVSAQVLSLIETTSDPSTAHAMTTIAKVSAR